MKPSIWPKSIWRKLNNAQRRAVEISTVEFIAARIRTFTPTQSFVRTYGHSGRGVYAYSSEYPEEGAELVCGDWARGGPLPGEEMLRIAKVIVAEEVKAGCWS